MYICSYCYYRLKIFQILTSLDDSSVDVAAQDPKIVDCFKDCLKTVDLQTMPWLSPSASSDVELLRQVEAKLLSDDEELEEQIINHTLLLLQRLYLIGTSNADFQSTHRVN